MAKLTIPRRIEDQLERINTHVSHLSHTRNLPDFLKTDWIQWRERLTFYMGLGLDKSILAKKYNAFMRWADSRKLAYLLNKLADTLDAFQDLQAHKNYLSKESYAAYKDLILQKVQIELEKLEINMLRKIEKAQSVKREERTTLVAEYAQHRFIFDIAISHQNPKLSKSINKNDLPLVYDFFKQQENKFRFSRQMDKSERISTVAQTAGAGLDLYSGVTSAVPTLGNIGQGILNFLSGIPIIAVIISAIPLVINNFKAWLQNKSIVKKGFAAAALGFAILGIGVAISSLTIAAFATTAGFVAAGLAVIGYIHDTILPHALWERQIERKKSEIVRIQSRMNDIKSDNIVTLTTNEKNILLQKIELRFLASSDMTTQEKKELKDALPQAIALILAGKIADFSANPLLEDMVKDISFKNILLSGASNQISALQKDIQQLKEKKKANRAPLGLGFFALFGAILICIPTPITQIAGYSLLAITAIIGLNMKFNITGRIRNLFSKEKNTVIPNIAGHTTEEATNHPYVNDQSYRNIHSVIPINHPTASVPYANDAKIITSDNDTKVPVNENNKDDKESPDPEHPRHP